MPPDETQQTQTQTPPPGETTTQTQTQTPPPAADWQTGFSDEQRGFVSTKGFKAPADVLDSYKNLEKLMGSGPDRLLKLPEKMDDDAAIMPIFDRLGRPGKAEEYKLPIPDGQDTKFADAVKPVMHKLGLTQKQAEGMTKWWNDTQAAAMTAHTDTQQTERGQQLDGLRKEWGAAYEQNIGAARRAAAEFGFDKDAIDIIENSMGLARTLKLFNDIGSKVGESAFHTGETTGFGGTLSPAQARGEIAALKGDAEFRKKYIAGDRAARTRMDQLHLWASA